MSVFQNLYTDSFTQYDEKLQEQEDITEYIFFKNYLLTVIDSFKWKFKTSLPLDMVEQFLARTGISAYDPTIDEKILPAFPSGSLMGNSLFDRYTLYNLKGETFERSINDIELCFNNSLRLPTINDVGFFAQKTAHAIMAVDSALNKAIVPTVISVNSEENLSTVGSILDTIKNLKPFRAILNKKYDDKSFQRVSAFDNRENDILSLWDVYVRYRNLFYSVFGINNVEITKKERLTEAEGSGNDEIVRYTILDNMYRNRKDFCERVKSHFNEDISVELNRDTQTVYELNTDNAKKLADQEILISKGSNIEKVQTEEETENESEI